MKVEITSTHELAEREWDGHTEPQEVDVNMVATAQPENKGIEFHVSMQSYTQHAMEDLIIEAAAKLLVGRHNERALAKSVEDKAMVMIDQRAQAVLAGITAEIIDQPVTPSYGDKKPVTMRELLGLYGREYLTETVDGNGKPTKRDSWNTVYSRMEFVAMKAFDRKFQEEIKKETNSAIVAIQNAIRMQHTSLLEAEKQRFREALDKASA